MITDHAVTELYQHIITAVAVLAPILSAMALFAWRISWRLGRIDHKIGIMWRAFCKAHHLDLQDGE